MVFDINNLTNAVAHMSVEKGPSPAFKQIMERRAAAKAAQSAKKEGEVDTSSDQDDATLRELAAKQ